MRIVVALAPTSVAKSCGQAITNPNRMRNTMSTAKEEVESLLTRLPDDCSLEDIQYHLYVFEKIRRGLERADTKGTKPQSEAMRLSCLRWAGQHHADGN
jgi:hypothetical protein